MKPVLAVGGILILLTLGLYLLSNITYDLNDITADNALKKLEIDRSRSLQSEWDCLSRVIETSTIFIQPKQIRPNQYWSVVREEDMTGIDYIIGNKVNLNIYTCRFPKKDSNSMDYFGIVNSIRDIEPKVMPIYGGKEIIHKLLYEQGFSLKTSSLKNHYDIVIKDTGDDFLVGQVFWMVSSPEEVMALDFHLYKKSRFWFF